MFFPELREKFDPVIDSMFQQKTHVEIRSIMNKMLSPHLDEAGGLIPEDIMAKFKKSSYAGLEEECLTAQEELDIRAARLEQEGVSGELIDHLDNAGRVLEAISYLDTNETSKETLFHFFYCLGGLITNEEIVRQAEAELT